MWSELKELRGEVKELRTENRAILETMTTLKVKIGVIVGVASTVFTIIVNYIHKKLGA